MTKPCLATIADGLVRIAAVITLDNVNKALAALVGLLSVIHLIIRIRKEARKPNPPRE